MGELSHHHQTLSSAVFSHGSEELIWCHYNRKLSLVWVTGAVMCVVIQHAHTACSRDQRPNVEVIAKKRQLYFGLY